MVLFFPPSPLSYPVSLAWVYSQALMIHNFAWCSAYQSPILSSTCSYPIQHLFLSYPAPLPILSSTSSYPIQHLFLSYPAPITRLSCPDLMPRAPIPQPIQHLLPGYLSLTGCPVPQFPILSSTSNQDFLPWLYAPCPNPSPYPAPLTRLSCPKLMLPAQIPHPIHNLLPSFLALLWCSLPRSLTIYCRASYQAFLLWLDALCPIPQSPLLSSTTLP
jgi:hypothetical protein